MYIASIYLILSVLLPFFDFGEAVFIPALEKAHSEATKKRTFRAVKNFSPVLLAGTAKMVRKSMVKPLNPTISRVMLETSGNAFDCSVSTSSLRRWTLAQLLLQQMYLQPLLPAMVSALVHTSQPGSLVESLMSG